VAEAVSGTKLSLELPTVESVDLDLSSLNVGDEISFVGSMFNQITSVKFDAVVAVFSAVSNTELKVTVPMGAVAGKISFIVPDGAAEIGNYKVILPTISSFIPVKGKISIDPRFFSLQGSGLELVDSIKIGNFLATIDQKTSTIVTFIINANASGSINLYTKNGVVTSTGKFLLAGDFWITDYSTQYTTVRWLPSSGSIFDKVNNPVVDTVSTHPYLDGGNYGKYYGESKGSWSVIYWRAPETGNNDKFSLSTDDPNGMTVSLDISYSQLPVNFIKDDGSVDIIVFIFTSSRNPYGFSRMINVPFTGAENWQHISVKMTDLYEDASVDDGTSPTVATKKMIKPNDMRIFAVTFPAASAAVGGSVIDINFDNLKFTIE
jgi:hypothetical protein